MPSHTSHIEARIDCESAKESKDEKSYRTAAHLDELSRRLYESWGEITKQNHVDFIRSVATKDLRLRNTEVNDRPQQRSGQPCRGDTIESNIARARLQRATDGVWKPTFLNSSTSLSEDGTLGEVWLAVERPGPDGGHPEMLRQAVSRFRWRWSESEKRWKWYYYDSLNGPAADYF
jgi:hypothetical protein